MMKNGKGKKMAQFILLLRGGNNEVTHSLHEASWQTLEKALQPWLYACYRELPQ